MCKTREYRKATECYYFGGPSRAMMYYIPHPAPQESRPSVARFARASAVFGK